MRHYIGQKHRHEFNLNDDWYCKTCLLGTIRSFPQHIMEYDIQTRMTFHKSFEIIRYLGKASQLIHALPNTEIRVNHYFESKQLFNDGFAF